MRTTAVGQEANHRQEQANKPTAKAQHRKAGGLRLHTLGLMKPGPKSAARDTEKAARIFLLTNHVCLSSALLLTH